MKKLFTMVSLCLFSVMSAMAETRDVASWDFTTGFAADKNVTVSGSTVTVSRITHDVGTNEFEGLAFQGSGSWKVYKNGGGLYNGNSGGRSMLILNLKKDDVITIKADAASMTTFSNCTMTTDGASDGNYEFTVTADGNVGVKSNPRNKKIYTISVTREFVAGTCEDPTSQITGANGNARTFTLACETANSEIYYSETELTTATGGTKYTAPVSTEATTIWAYAKTSDATSDVIPFSTGAGTTLALNAPAIVNNGFAAGKYTVSLTSNQESVLGKPATTIKYTVDGGAANTYAAPFAVAEGAVIAAWTEAAGYANSPNTNVTTTTYCTAPVAFTETYNGVVTTNYGFILGAESSVAGYYALTYDNDKIVSNKLFVQQLKGSGNDLMRANGVYFAAGTNVAIADVKAGDVITLNGVYGNAAYYVSGSNNVVKDEWNSVEGAKYVFTVIADGDAYLNIARYGYTQNITIQRIPATVPVTISAAGYATFVTPYAVDFTDNAIEAYTVSAVNANTVTLKKVTQVPADEAVIVKGESGNVNVIASAEAITNELKVATEAIEFDENADNINYVLAQVNGNVGLYPVNEGTIAAGKGYLPVAKNNAANAKGGFTFVTDNVTAVEVAEATPAVVKNGKFATAEGIVIVKDGVKYNVAGMKK